jgi:2-succinyl-5-enolpyruvyl-6-hydroxy-3-cyclohexene-1-carboxylate synthase
LTIVVFNNDGGGIFSFLPIAKIPAHFEELFATPHGLGFSSVGALFGARYAQPRTPEELRSCVRGSLEGGLHLIEVQTHRDQNVQAHHRLFEELVAAVGDGPWA